MKKSHTSDNTTFRCAFIHRYVLISIIVMYLLPMVPLSQHCFAQTMHAITRATAAGQDSDAGFFSSTSSNSSPLTEDNFWRSAQAFSSFNNGGPLPHFFLGGISEAEVISPFASGNFIVVSESWWVDGFTVSGLNIPNQLRFHYQLTGLIKLDRYFAGHSGAASASVWVPEGSINGTSGGIIGTLPVAGEATFQFQNMTGDISGPDPNNYYHITGTSFFDVGLNFTGGTARGNLHVYLKTTAQSSGQVDATANFMNTFGYTAITLTDGTPLSDAGLSIQFDSVVAVPEPATYVLCALGMSATGVGAWRYRRRTCAAT